MRETPQAAAAYEEYCTLGLDRSLRKLAESQQKYSKSIALLMRWSVDHNWQERVKQYDKERIDERRRKHDAALEKMNEEHALLGRTQALRAVKQIEELIKAQKFGSQATVQLFKVSTDLERLARGAATERQELTGKDGEALGVGIYLPQKDSK